MHQQRILFPKINHFHIKQEVDQESFRRKDNLKQKKQYPKFIIKKHSMSQHKREYKYIPDLWKNKSLIKGKSNPLSPKHENSLHLDSQLNETNDGDGIRRTSQSVQNNQSKQTRDEYKLQKIYESVIQRIRMLVPSKKDTNVNKFNPLIQKLKQMNPFFCKLPKESAYLLLKIGKIITIQKDKVIYEMNSISKYFYIILYGAVLLKDKVTGFIKYSKTGQALAEEEIFVNQAQYNIKIRQSAFLKHNQMAKTQIQTCLLRISKKKYYQLEHQMYEKGNICKTLFVQIDNSLKLQYLFKMMARNQAVDKRNKKCVTKRSYTEMDN